MSIGVFIDITVVLLVSYYDKSALPTTYISSFSISPDSDVVRLFALRIVSSVEYFARAWLELVLMLVLVGTGVQYKNW